MGIVKDFFRIRCWHNIGDTEEHFGQIRAGVELQHGPLAPRYKEYKDVSELRRILQEWDLSRNARREIDSALMSIRQENIRIEHRKE